MYFFGEASCTSRLGNSNQLTSFLHLRSFLSKTTPKRPNSYGRAANKNSNSGKSWKNRIAVRESGADEERHCVHCFFSALLPFSPLPFRPALSRFPSLPLFFLSSFPLHSFLSISFHILSLNNLLTITRSSALCHLAALLHITVLFNPTCPRIAPQVKRPTYFHSLQYKPASCTYKPDWPHFPLLPTY